MRIDFIITELFVGGAEHCLTALATGMAEQGDDVRVFSIGSLPERNRQDALVEKLRKADIEITSANANTGREAVSAYRQLRQWLKESRPDICQTFLHHANVLGTLAAKSAGVQHRVAGIRVAESKAFRCAIEKFALRASTTVICVSRAVERFAAERLGCPAAKLLVIPNGVDAGHFSNAEPYHWPDIGWPQNAIVTLYAGRLHPQKGIELLQAEIDQLAPVGSNQRLLLVGDGPLRSELETWAEKRGPQQVQLLGWRPDIASLMAASRLIVLPSHYEGMPNVILEAMAAGKPVVCSRVEGSQELLKHDWDQQSFPAGDGVQMARLASRYIEQQDLAMTAGAGNQSLVRQHHALASMVAEYRSHYQELLNR